MVPAIQFYGARGEFLIDHRGPAQAGSIFDNDLWQQQSAPGRTGHFHGL